MKISIELSWVRPMVRPAARRWLGRAMAAATLTLATACATVPAGTVNDPYEGFNRSMFSINEALDKAVLKPAATVYRAVTPSFVRTAVGNFFANLAEPWVAVNAALQLKGQAAVETVVRFGVNTVFGLGGVLDIASEMNLERRNEDFGQTLAFWGTNSGPYLVLPFFGPSTVRDGLALVVDYQGDPVTVNPNLTSNERTGLSVLRLVSFRESLLRAGELLDEAALDKYTFTRDVYLQRRQALVFDGQEPPEDKAAPAK